MVQPIHPWPLPPNNTVNGWGTQGWFEHSIKLVDPWAEVEFDNQHHLIRITPSRVCYRDAIIAEAKMQRPIGVPCSVMKLVDDFECTQMTPAELGIESIAIPVDLVWWKRLWKKWRNQH